MQTQAQLKEAACERYYAAHAEWSQVGREIAQAAKALTFPQYVTEPGLPNSVHDIIVNDGCEVENDRRKIRWISSYQGETDYEPTTAGGSRLHFRWGKLPWVWGFEKPGTKYWNYATEEEFQREFNGAWGILHCGCNPVDVETLENFRREYYRNAVTGYYDHDQNAWVQCDPTSAELGTISWKKSARYLQFCKEMGYKP